MLSSTVNYSRREIEKDYTFGRIFARVYFVTTLLGGAARVNSCRR